MMNGLIHKGEIMTLHMFSPNNKASNEAKSTIYNSTQTIKQLTSNLLKYVKHFILKV